MKGDSVKGLALGKSVTGMFVGDAEGENVVDVVGLFVPTTGDVLGSLEGFSEGLAFSDGELLGVLEATAVGVAVGAVVGLEVGAVVGPVGLEVGAVVGLKVGAVVGSRVGAVVGSGVGAVVVGENV